ncbi:MAG: hypothetical protein IPN68_16875 [Bacteroidetes bacterium]|nr:hypothetical protein [Bacteroidota bacterium]
MINNWCSSNAAYTTVGASADKNKGTCWANGPNYNRWFKFQATSTNLASIKLKTGGAEGTLQHPFMALWESDGITQIALMVQTITGGLNSRQHQPI